MRWSLMALVVLSTLTLLLPSLSVATESPDKKPSKGKAKLTDEKVLLSIETNLMTLFGLSRRPRPDRTTLEVPSEMLEMYKKQTGLDLDTTSLPLPGRHTASANTVRSFTHKESSVDAQFPHSHRFRLSFPVDSIPESEKLQAAELQLSRVALAFESLETPHVLVHDIVLPGIRGKRDPLIRLVDSQRVSHQDGTVKLDVTPAVQRWLAEPSDNHGLLVVVTFPRTNSSGSASVRVNRHVRLRRDASEEPSEWRKVEPVLLTYTDDGKHAKSSGGSPSRLRRGVRKHKRKDGRELCRRHELYVDFTDVGWNDWIVAPPGYDAFYCSGDCPFPLSDHFNSTNHAIVQTLVNSVFPNTAPRACCVPTALAPISMLYVDEEGKVVLKNYQDMSILGCGCR